MDLFPIMGLSYNYRDDIEKYRKDGVKFVCVGIPWGLIEPHDKQAQSNHSQTLKRLAERGGLSPVEAVAVLEGKTWKDVATMSNLVAVRKLLEYVQMYENPHLKWAVERWNAEVKNRPLSNIHRRSLDDAWRQVMRRFGGDPVALCGPSHDDLLEVSRK